jgi:methanogenic corrinoid protein MtbC1
MILRIRLPVVKTLKEAGLGHSRILIAGASMSESFARCIGTDGYLQSAVSAVDKARELVGFASSQ